MEATPVSSQLSEDSGCISGTFSLTHSFLESTPNVENHTTPSLKIRSRKRRFIQSQLNERKLHDVIELYPSTPQFSSTLNESLVNNLENCHIKTNSAEKCKGPRRTSTPEKKTETSDKKFKTCRIVEESPVKEAHDILYANIKFNVGKKSFSPTKFRENLEKFNSSAKKCLFDSSERLRTFKLFTEVTSNPVIMPIILSYLSDGDLYRLSLVSNQLKQGIVQSLNTRKRYEVFMEVHRENKENYKVTPPRSPEKNDSPPGSPSSFNNFFKIGRLLKENQSLTKCRRCGKPSILENSIAQCQNLTSCGYIYCLKCLSCSETGPEDFYDRCQSSALTRSSRTKLSDMSNSGRYSNAECSSTSFYSIFHSPKSSRNFEDSSGFYSENEYSPFPARRNLSDKLKNVRSRTQVFHLYNDVVNPSITRKRKLSLAAVPVIALENTGVQDVEPPSPPKIRNVAGSKQSKRNLKRLTR